jgi:ATP-dependent phosphofructokinase / diphosphate-dependent phosphofructokinase
LPHQPAEVANVCALDHGQAGIMVVLDPPTVNYVPVDQGTQHMKTVPPDCNTILTARDLGISFGD